MRFKISFDGYVKQGRVKTPCRMFVTSCKFADTGFKVKSVSYSNKPEKAASFSRTAAEEIAAQYKFTFVNLRIESEQTSIDIKPTEQEIAQRRAVNAEMETINREFADMLRKVIR